MAKRGAKRKRSFGCPPLQKKSAIAAVTTTISELPDDILCKIIIRISDIKSLVRCKKVCKTWRNLILQPYFAKSHLSRGSLPRSLILYRPSNAPTNPIHFGIIELNDDFGSLSRQNATLKFRSEIYIRHKRDKGRVIGACNGLVCLWVNKDIVVCNPILPGRHFVLPKLPKLAQAFSSFGFGYGPLSDEYKVLTCTVTCENHWYNTTLSIFTLGRDDTWRSIEGHNGQPFHGYYDGGGFVFVNGALHWIVLGMDSPFLCYFDVENEELGSLPLPSGYIGDLTHLGVLDDFLYLSDRSSLSHGHVWVMTDYIQTGAWTLKWVVKLQCLNVLFEPVLPIKVLKDGTVLLIFNDKFVGSHNPQTGVTKRITYHGVRFWLESIAYTPSFLCPPCLL